MLRSIIAAGLLLAAPALSQNLTPAETAQVDKIVTDGLAATETPAAAIAIVRGGQIVFAKTYGKPSATMAAGTPDTPFQIASNSKQFTAAAMLLLADEHKLSLDDTVGKYLSGISGGDTITIRQLLSHTSGIQDYWPQDYSFADMAHPVTPQAIVDRWAKKPLDFAPGTQWQYSNTGFVVAGMIVEKVSGVPLLDFLNARIFKPLGITAYDQDLAVGKGFPQGYGRAALGPVRVVEPAAHGWLYAAGELSLSARDFAKWDVARINRTVLTPADWAAQETEIKLSDGKGTGYGLGVDVGSKDGLRFVKHDGEAVGFLSENVVYPDQKAAIVVLTNSWSGNAYTAISAALTKLLVPDAADARALTRARLLYDQLRRGTLDRSQLTSNAAYYFTQTVTGDYHDSLSKLGDPIDFKQSGETKLRGGFVIREYDIRYPGRTLALSTFLEPGDTGRFEQFLVDPKEP
ncbi:serine hydrolase domain-containing protein [Sphingomonas vulcanisoli]|nr:serine hydrolase domain-containing protein [Sphingomonas vulcanisoli]